MQGVDLQSEKRLIAEPVSLSLKGFDLVVGSFPGRGGDGAIVIGQKASAVEAQRGGKLLEHADAGACGAGDPIVEESFRRRFVLLVPDLPQVFLHVVNRG